MVIQHSANAKIFKDISSGIQEILPSISEAYLRHVIETISVPRHYIAEKANNERVARWIRHQFESFGYQVSFQGRFDNILVLPTDPLPSSSMLVLPIMIQSPFRRALMITAVVLRFCWLVRRSCQSIKSQRQRSS